ncbi:MAG: Gx transporter family protein [Anaerovoracaceae bacterium]|nr:Gx transporter family protein [Clostridiales bacterium]
MQTASPTRKVALSGVLVSLAAIFSYVETLVPLGFGVPGIKLGLANVVVVFALYSMGVRYALTINVVRIIVVASLFGSPVIMLYSLSGALLSLLVMVILYYTNKFSMVGVSMAGGVFHNIGQLLVAAAVVETFQILYYFPVLLVAGMITGIIIGIIVTRVSRLVTIKI